MISKNPSSSTSAFLKILFVREKTAVAGAPSPPVAAVVGAVAAEVGAVVVIVGAVVVVFVVVVVDDIADVVASVDVPSAFEAATKEEDLNF